MDQSFGGLGKGNTSVFEYDESVPYSAIRLVEVPAIVNALNVGHGVVCIPLPGSGVERLVASIRSGTTEDAVRERLAIGTWEDSNKHNPPFYGLGSEDVQTAARRVTELFNDVREKSEAEGVLFVASVSQLEGAWASDVEKVVERLSSRIASIQRLSIDSMLLLIHSSSEARARIISMCHEYARLFMKCRSVVLVGEKPSTEAMVLEHSLENPILPTLTRIV